MIRGKYIVSFVAAFILLAAASAFGQGTAEGNSSEQCASGYAYDPQKSECVACNQPCDTGQPGICGRGIVDCSSKLPQCRSAIKPGERMEICNGEDDNCNGRVDETFDKDNDRYTTCGGDCDDRNAKVHPDAVERCDGEDNNCNGLVDDGFNIGGVCTVALGACASEGRWKCDKSKLDAICDALPGEPSMEICNAKDDDCNGLIDDGLGDISCGVGACKRIVPACVSGGVPECSPGQPVTELCGDNIDNNCDGKVDEGFEGLGKLCSEGVGACKVNGKLVCAEDVRSLTCSAKAGVPVEEICGNRIDDNCNGIIDTDIEGIGSACTNELLGECLKDGALVCNKESGKLMCSAPVKQGIPERCDNKDNDCDGVIDNDVVETASCGKGKCIGGTMQRSCELGQWGEWGQCSTFSNASEEICGNHIDDNCNGIVDDDAVGLGDVCNNGLIGACRREGRLTCEGLSGKLACSAKPVESGDEICNGIDDDCDGEIDEGVTNACGGCGELPGNLGEACDVPGDDPCAKGIWTCKSGDSSGMECTLEPKRTDGNACLPDENPCTLDICQHGKCSHPSTKDGLSCNDGDLCTVQDSCFNGTCQGGAQRACDDGNSCTIDACSIKRGCYHEAIGGGIVNACGGCETLKMFPGEHCQVAGEKGICQSGSYVCQPDGTISCVQNAFSSKEECNGFDDNCNGEIDEGFGASTCGIGECEVAVDNCSEGVLKTCIPRDPLPETCVNHKKDDDCNGVVDDIAGLGQDCPVAFGTCIIPGKKRCIGDAEFPICVPFNPKDAEDGDGDGIVNYCDHGDSIASDVEIEVSDTIAHGNGTSTSARLLDTIQTRAMMLPWQDVYDSIVIAPNSPDQAMLLISGMGAESGGIAAMRAKDVGGGGTITFRSCTAPQGLVPSKLISAGDIADIIAISDKNYVIYPKIASQIPSAIVSNMNCELKGEKVVNDVKRFWKEGGKENTCIVDAVADLQKISDSPLVFAGAVTCTSKSQSVWKKNRVLLGVDLLTQQSNGSFLHRFAPAKIDTAEITDVRIAHDRRGGILLSALFSGERFVGRCVTAGDGIDCWNQKVDKPVDKTIYFDTLTASNERIYPTIVSEDGRAFVVNFDLKERSASVIEAGRVRAKDAENVYSLIEFPSQKDRTPIMIVAEDAHLAAASLSYNKQGGLMLRSIRGVKFIPESVADDIYVGEKMELVRPHAMSIVPLKNYGGHDLYVSYDIKKGFKKLGEMGFFYWNANETPVGSVVDVSFNGRKGHIAFSFDDPTNDKLTYRATIRANYGGSLDKWIDGFKEGKLYFSVKGDDAAVGTWPIKMKIEASDSGGLVAISNIVLRRNGTIEVISESEASTMPN